MLSRWTVGTILKEQYEITEIFGSDETMAAYLVADLVTQRSLILWESTEPFALRHKPQGVREYFLQDGRHYLALQLEGQSLAFLLTIAGRIDGLLAGSWMLHICRAVGYWHNRSEAEPLLCLKQAPLNLSVFTLSAFDQVMIPVFHDFAKEAPPLVEADAYRLAAPEQEAGALTPRSDVYALGAMFYTLVAGQPPPAPEALQTREAQLAPPSRINDQLTRPLEKVILKAMHLDPRKRYPTAAEMAADLEAIVIPALVEEEGDAKPSLLMRIAPFLVALALLACLAVAVAGVSNPNIDLSWLLGLRGEPTPTHAPRPSSTPRPSPTPSPTVEAVNTPLPVVALKVVVNQVRTDEYPQMIAYTSVLDDKQEAMQDLPLERFWVVQDGQIIEEFQLAAVDAARDPLALVVAIDISGSMRGDPLKKARLAASNFVGRFDTADQVSPVQFDDRIELVTAFTTDKDAVIAAIKALRPRSDTALYDVVAYSVERLTPLAGRRAVIVLTDGRDTASVKNKLKDSVAAASEANIPVFVVGLDSPQFTPEAMERISSGTGGDYLFAPNPDDLDALYPKIRGQLQNQYRIEFTSMHDADGGEHTLGVGVDLGGGEELYSEKPYRSP